MAAWCGELQRPTSGCKASCAISSKRTGTTGSALSVRLYHNCSMLEGQVPRTTCNLI